MLCCKIRDATQTFRECNSKRTNSTQSPRLVYRFKTSVNYVVNLTASAGSGSAANPLDLFLYSWYQIGQVRGMWGGHKFFFLPLRLEKIAYNDVNNYAKAVVTAEPPLVLTNVASLFSIMIIPLHLCFIAGCQPDYKFRLNSGNHLQLSEQINLMILMDVNQDPKSKLFSIRLLFRQSVQSYYKRHEASGFED